MLILFDMLDSLTLSLLFLCKYEKGFSGYPVVGVEGHCGWISRSFSQFFLKMFSGVLYGISGNHWLQSFLCQTTYPEGL